MPHAVVVAAALVDETHSVHAVELLTAEEEVAESNSIHAVEVLTAEEAAEAHSVHAVEVLAAEEAVAESKSTELLLAAVDELTESHSLQLEALAVVVLE